MRGRCRRCGFDGDAMERDIWGRDSVDMDGIVRIFCGTAASRRGWMESVRSRTDGAGAIDGHSLPNNGSLPDRSITIDTWIDCLTAIG